MKLVSAAQMRELDRQTIEERGIPGHELMDRAGRESARVVLRLIETSRRPRPFVLLAAGRGNNGGDAFATARHLQEAGLHCELWLACRAEGLAGDALHHFELARAAGVPCREMPEPADWTKAGDLPPGVDLIVDGLLGTGSSGAPRGVIAEAIARIRAWSRDALVVSLDIPSGLDADTGAAADPCVFADETVTMGLPKKGLLAPAAIEYVGSLSVADIGIPAELAGAMKAEDPRELIAAGELRPLVRRRPRNAHKGDFGRILLIGGAPEYAGAIVMAAQAAIRSGAGLVTVLAPARVATRVSLAVPECMAVSVDETEIGSLSHDGWSRWKDRLRQAQAVLVGPGMTRHAHSLLLVRSIIRECIAPLVLDADAISVLAGDAHWIQRAQCPVAITPHPGELATLCNMEVEDIQRDRSAAALHAARQTGAIVILKGAGTLVAREGAPLFVNMTGNPGMATGGSGDVLAGLLAGLLGQGYDPFDAARLAVFLHGRAGDAVARRTSQAGLVAGDLIRELPLAHREMNLH